MDIIKLEKRRYLTQDDIPYLEQPCYITDSGDVYQYSRKEKKVIHKKVRYDDRQRVVKVSLSLQQGARNGTTAIVVATYVYRCFTDEKSIPDRLFINYKDGDPMNCAFNNLYRTEKFVGEFNKSRKTTRKNTYGLQSINNVLTLSDLLSVKAFIELKIAHCKKNIAKTDLVIDTTGWSSEDLQELGKISHMDGVCIKK
jgi:hypothetical protein